LDFIGGSYDLSCNQTIKIANLPCLNTICGSLNVIANPQLTCIDFPCLNNIACIGSCNNMQLTKISLPKLECTSSNINICLNDNLTCLDIPCLIYVGGVFRPANGLLTCLSVPCLTTVNCGFSPSNMPLLTCISTPKLTNVCGSYDPSSFPLLTTLEAPCLSYTTYFGPNNLNSLTCMNFPCLSIIAGDFCPNSLPSLTCMNFPCLTTVCGIIGPVCGNVSLQCILLPNLVNTCTVGIQSNTIQCLDLTCLTNVYNIFSFSSCSLRNLSLPNLTYALNFCAGLGNINTNLVCIDTPKLSCVGFAYIIDGGAGSAGLQCLNTPCLTNVCGSLQINNWTTLTNISYPKLNYVGNNYIICCNNALTSIDFPCLSYVRGGITFTCNPLLTNICYPKLECVLGSITTTATSCNLVTFNTPCLTYLGGALTLCNEISCLPKLNYVVGSVNFCGNCLCTPCLSCITGSLGYLSACNICMDVSNLSFIGGTLTISSSSFALRNLCFPKLDCATGISTSATQLACLNFPCLRVIGTSGFSNPGGSLTCLNLPLLTCSLGQFSTGACSRLNVNAPCLTFINGNATFCHTCVIFPSLACVGGTTLCPASNITICISLPNLCNITTDLALNGATSLVTACFPNLVNVGRAVNLSGNVCNQTICFPKLCTVGNYAAAIQFQVNGGTQCVIAPCLVSIGNCANTTTCVGLYLGTCVKCISMPSLNFASSACVITSILPILSLPSLKIVDQCAAILCNACLTCIDLPALQNVALSFCITCNNALTCINIPCLQTIYGGILPASTMCICCNPVSDLGFSNNPRLILFGSIRCKSVVLG
jgi:hypothetical protein